MQPSHPPKPTKTGPSRAERPQLERLLERPDIWRGRHSGSSADHGISSGHPALDQVLHHQGWPHTGISEVSQTTPWGGEWLLLAPALKQLATDAPEKSLALLSPPALPFIDGLTQLQIDVERLLIIQTQSAQEFISSFVDIVRGGAFYALLAWQQQLRIPYQQLRKLQLAALEQEGLHVLFRDMAASRLSSPAQLRLKLHPRHQQLEVVLFKQKGLLNQNSVLLDIPASWKRLPHHNLEDTQNTANEGQPLRHNDIYLKERTHYDAS